MLEAWEAEQSKAESKGSSGASDGESSGESQFLLSTFYLSLSPSCITLRSSLFPASPKKSSRDQWKAVPTGDAAYRAIVPTSKLLEDPDLKRFVEYSEMTGWMGPDRHVMAYCIVSPLNFFRLFICLQSVMILTFMFVSVAVESETGIQPRLDSSR